MQPTEPVPDPEAGQSILASLKQAPVVSLWLIIACVCLPVSLQSPLVSPHWINGLFIIDPALFTGAAADDLRRAVEQGALWRLVTPAFLHFSAVHIIFNSVLFLILGVGLEKRLGAGLLLLCLLLWAAVSNISQFLYVGSPLFGGLSGVVSAMFGARWVMGFLRPNDAALYLPRPLVVSVLLSLIVFSTGISALMGVSVANTAHWSGLIIGLITGAALHLLLPGAPTKATELH